MNRLSPNTDQEKMQTLVARLEKAFIGGKGMKLSRDGVSTLRGCLVELTVSLMSKETELGILRDQLTGPAIITGE